jgi:hypothetical protein
MGPQAYSWPAGIQTVSPCAAWTTHLRPHHPEQVLPRQLQQLRPHPRPPGPRPERAHCLLTRILRPHALAALTQPAVRPAIAAIGGGGKGCAIGGGERPGGGRGRGEEVGCAKEVAGEGAAGRAAVQIEEADLARDDPVELRGWATQDVSGSQGGVRLGARIQPGPIRPGALGPSFFRPARGPGLTLHARWLLGCRPGTRIRRRLPLNFEHSQISSSFPTTTRWKRRPTVSSPSDSRDFYGNSTPSIFTSACPPKPPTFTPAL